MRTTLDLPESLVSQAVQLSKEKTKTGAIVTALQEYIRLKKLQRLARSAGSVKIDPNYSWSEVRHKR